VRTHGGVCTSMRMSIDSCQINPNVPPKLTLSWMHEALPSRR
jgi:hypothetical protein